jgi:diguanylate cyclase (GGDEF)-like protein/PAS domain S-box-containing protein
MKQLFVPSIFTEEKETQDARLLYVFLWAFMVAVTVMILVAIVLPETTVNQLLLIGTVDASSILLIILTRRGYTKLVSWMIVLQVWIVTTAVVSTGGGIHSPLVTLYLIAVLIAGLMLGRTTGIIIAGFCLLTELVLVQLEQADILLPSVIQHNALTLWVSNTGAMIIIVTIQYFASSTFKGSFDRIYRELNERKQVEVELRESEQRFRAIFDSVNDAISIHDIATGEILYANECMCELSGYTREEAGKVNIAMLSSGEPPYTVQEALKWLKGAAEGSPQLIQWHVKDKQGRLFWVEVNMRRAHIGGLDTLVIAARDITERKHMYDKIQVMAVTDDLTGLYNRRGFITLAEQQLKMAERTKKKLLLTFIDLDNMKRINDIWGHEEGDRSLIKTAEVLKQTFRDSDIIARIGGDEYAVLASDITENTQDIFMKRLQQQLDEHNAHEERDYRLSLSIGAAIYDPETPCSLDHLISKADKLMYEDKHRKEILERASKASNL